MFKGLTNLSALMRQAQEVGGRLQQLQDQLKLRRVSGSAGAGMVTVEANGLGQVLKITIEPALVERNEREMIEDLLAAAVNDVLAKAKQMHVEAVKELTEGVDLPGLEGAIERFAGIDTSNS